MIGSCLSCVPIVYLVAIQVNTGLYEGMRIDHKGVMAFDDQFRIRIEKDVKEALEEVPNRRGITFADWVRLILREEAVRWLKANGYPVPSRLVDAKVSKRTRKDVEPKIPPEDTGRIIPLDRNKPRDGE